MTEVAPTERIGNPITIVYPTAEELTSLLHPLARIALEYEHNTEAHVAAFSLFARLNPLYLYNPDYQNDIQAWDIEEKAHEDQTAVVLTEYDAAFNKVENRKAQLAQHDQIKRYTRPFLATALPVMIGTAANTATIALKAFRNELETAWAYSTTIVIADHPFIDRAIPPIRNQEPRHAAMNERWAMQMLDGSRRTQRAVRFIFSHMPGIVGEGFLGKAAATTLIRTLNHQRDAVERAAQIDARISQLPGMQDLHVVENRVKAALAA